MNKKLLESGSKTMFSCVPDVLSVKGNLPAFDRSEAFSYALLRAEPEGEGFLPFAVAYAEPVPGAGGGQFDVE